MLIAFYVLQVYVYLETWLSANECFRIIGQKNLLAQYILYISKKKKKGTYGANKLKGMSQHCCNLTLNVDYVINKL